MTTEVSKLPPGCQHLMGQFFAVRFSDIRIPDPDENAEGYAFKNPRILTESGQAALLDKKLSADLRESIKNHTLLQPLVCRWVTEEDGTVYPQLVAGERRYRAVDFLIRKKEIVVDPKSLHQDEEGNWVYEKCSAEQAYETIPCQIFQVNNDLDTLAIAWAENKSRVDLTDGHEVAEVAKLRSVNASDEKILEILQRDEKWLAETDSLLTNLDANTLADLLEGKIDRDSAVVLATIKNVEIRDKVRVAANEAANEACNKKLARIQRRISSALDEKEIAEGSLADAEFQQDDEAIQEAEEEVQEAQKKVKRTVKERDETKPVTSASQVKKAAAEIESEGDSEERIFDKPPRILSAKKIKEGLEYIEALIKNGGECLEGTFTANVEELTLVRKILNNNILANEVDFSATIRRHMS